MAVTSRNPSEASAPAAGAPPRPSGALLATGLALPEDRVPAGRSRRCAARPDEDALTLAAEAGAEALAAAGAGAGGPAGAPAPVALLLATTTPPYFLGGNAQALAELLRLAPETAVAELTATACDGLAAVRLGLALAAAYGAAVLVCATHASAGRGGAEDGDGAVALLLGPACGPAGLATLSAGPTHVEELRDRWQLAGEPDAREGDTSFIHAFGGTRLAEALGRRAAAEAPGPVAVSTLNGRAGARAERTVGGGGDPVAARTGLLGAAHPLLRLACGLDGAPSRTVVAVAGGRGESIHVAAEPAGAAVAARLLDRACGGTDRDAPMPIPSGEGFEPYASGPRAWRERGQDLRLEGVRYGTEVFYPPPAAPPPGHAGEPAEAVPLARTGTVLTHTRDHVYPGGEVTGMAVIDLDDGSRFYGQVAMGETVAIADRVRLVPRRLHQGGGVVQYFWKVTPCR